ncbi:MAG: PQQ-dependent sugar dehydrogenase, partial [Deltaproteobacteria bacterium]|nr:PQQ-dependent sugar dehydrogenase [Deltaproteobacteria bacterium]
MALRLLPLVLAWSLTACRCSSAKAPQPGSSPGDCLLVREGDGPTGSIPARAETVVSGLEVPWAIGFLPDGDLLVSERPGRVRLVHDGQLVPEPVIRFPTVSTAEGGLMGLALAPDFARSRWLYLYRTVDEEGGAQANRVERWRLAADARTASFDRVVFAGIRAARFHDGGRIRFGPDGMLYVGTGDATEPSLSQERASPNGKLLRLTPEGQIPPDNPLPGNAAYLLGLRNPQGFDWVPDPRALVIADHGPSGELGGRRGHDEISLAGAGAN